ncbi:hypothetical protein [Lysinibacillus capsici]|uniref:hypothetical protein n=1 Tax=Lysinibacillus capsici TaxID=2115968 RepID=UPI002E22B2A9|nr:hypothetical protein [Lysinibacillus capsici]
MDWELKKELEAHIFEKDDKILFNFLEQNFSVRYVSDIKLFENINTYKCISAHRKRILVSRLAYMEESYDLTTIFTGIIALILSFLGIYKVFLEELMPTGFYSITMIIIYVMCIGIFANSLGTEKGRRAKVKYFLTLFKEI